MAHFSLSWDAHKQNICSGLSALQQNGEFVDMTLAADGHHVKVHQMVMSLVSPYIKDLITSASCPHPVIFFNRISYATLCAILEYIYTGEVLVPKENLSELLEASKELHIKGLEDMKLEMTTEPAISQTIQALENEGQPLSETRFFDSEDDDLDQAETTKNQFVITKSKPKATSKRAPIDNSHVTDTADHTYDAMDTDHDIDALAEYSVMPAQGPNPETRIQYTLSNQGSLQMILNRFIYYLRYTSRKGPKGHRQWRCVEYVRAIKCPAIVITKEDYVVKRFAAHNHPFHDKRIMKKVQDNAIYSAIHEAEVLGQSKKQDKKRPSAPVEKSVDSE